MNKIKNYFKMWLAFLAFWFIVVAFCLYAIFLLAVLPSLTVGKLYDLIF